MVWCLSVMTTNTLWTRVCFFHLTFVSSFLFLSFPNCCFDCLKMIFFSILPFTHRLHSLEYSLELEINISDVISWVLGRAPYFDQRRNYILMGSTKIQRRYWNEWKIYYLTHDSATFPILFSKGNFCYFISFKGGKFPSKISLMAIFSFFFLLLRIEKKCWNDKEETLK